jgi:hypothetical protein
MGTLLEYVVTFMTISRLILLRIRNISDKIVEKIKTHTSCSINFFPPENLAVYEIMPKNMVEPDRWQMAI